MRILDRGLYLKSGDQVVVEMLEGISAAGSDENIPKRVKKFADVYG